MGHLLWLGCRFGLGRIAKVDRKGSVAKENRSEEAEDQKRRGLENLPVETVTFRVAPEVSPVKRTKTSDESRP
ncbi:MULTISPECIES: hypothetical protein [unclassified Bradyrhizobium]|uniref:hypothetical protein n=1 Tax=unclassified Bradyrhizobium TaxID=2631580 RepID=UPI0028E82A51|nr:MULTISPECIES: hypothetical protein [unclassified Bradyrhizobium]